MTLWFFSFLPKLFSWWLYKPERTIKHISVNVSAQEGSVEINGTNKTLLVSPLAEFYSIDNNERPNPGRTQMRIAFVETPEQMKLVPKLFSELLKQYLNK